MGTTSMKPMTRNASSVEPQDMELAYFLRTGTMSTAPATSAGSVASPNVEPVSLVHRRTTSVDRATDGRGRPLTDEHEFFGRSILSFLAPARIDLTMHKPAKLTNAKDSSTYSSWQLAN